MAHVFTTTFPYREETYTAVITQIDGSLSIYVPDSTLHDILPEGKVNLNTQQGLRIDTPHLSPAQDLIVSILSAIEMQSSKQPQQQTKTL